MDDLYEQVLEAKHEYDYRRSMYLVAKEKQFDLAIRDYREAEKVYHNLCVRYFEEVVDSMNEC